jgi:peroxiredoxin
LTVLMLACTAALAQSRSPQALVRSKAPEITRKDLNGHSLSLAALRGKVVLLNFWATWCAPCQAEMPVFSAWQRQYGARGLQIVGISMDDGAAPAQKLVKKLRVDYPVAMGDVQLGRRYGGVLGLPLTFLIDRKGVVRAVFQGDSSLKAIEAQMQTLLGER